MVERERIVSVDDQHYYFDLRSKLKVESFYPGVSFYMQFSDGSIICIPPEMLYNTLEGIYFKVNGTRYMIADNKSPISLKFGYFVHGNYDQDQEQDVEKGLRYKRKTFGDLLQGWTEYLYRHSCTIADQKIIEQGKNFKVQFNYGRYQLSISICSIDNLVRKNHVRKKNNLQYLPFNPKMDRYNSYYLHAQAIQIYDQMSLFDLDSEDQDNPSSIINTSISEVLSIMNKGYAFNYNDYRFINLNSKKK